MKTGGFDHYQRGVAGAGGGGVVLAFYLCIHWNIFTVKKFNKDNKTNMEGGKEPPSPPNTHIRGQIRNKGTFRIF